MYFGNLLKIHVKHIYSFKHHLIVAKPTNLWKLLKEEKLRLTLNTFGNSFKYITALNITSA